MLHVSGCPCSLAAGAGAQEPAAGSPADTRFHPTPVAKADSAVTSPALLEIRPSLPPNPLTVPFVSRT